MMLTQEDLDLEITFPLWGYLNRFLSRGFPTPLELRHHDRHLLTCKRQRELPDEWKAKLGRTGRSSDDRRAFTAVLLYLIGTKGSCTNCGGPARPAIKKKLGFQICVALPETTPEAVRSHLGSSCCNCFLSKHPRPCAFVPNVPRPKIINDDSWTHTSRETSQSSEEDADVSRLASEVEDERPSPSSPAQTSALPAAPLAFSINSQSLPIENTKTVYEVEKWEFAPGCIRSEAEGRPNSKLVAIFCSFVVAHGRLTDNLK